MRTRPVGTGPFKFVEFKRGDSIRLVRNPDYFKKGRPYLDAIDIKIIENRSTRILAFATGEFDLTFPTDVSVPLMKDMKAQAPKAVCEFQSTGVYGQPDRQPRARRRSTTPRSAKPCRWRWTARRSTPSSTKAPAPSAAPCCRCPRANGRMPQDVLEKLPGYGPDVEKNRAEARKHHGGARLRSVQDR